MTPETTSDAPRGWTEVRVHAPLGWQELVAETLSQMARGSAVLGLATIGTTPAPAGTELVRVYLAPDDDTAARRAEIEDGLRELARRAQAPELAALRPAYRELPPEDYASSWKKVWKPFRVGRLAVVQPWREAALRPSDVRFALVPGATFGTGRHATTRTALRLAERLVRPGERVLDAGTGSGILAVAALLLGAAEAFGFDIDPQSRSAGLELARRNGVAERATFTTGGFELLAGQEARWDGLFANIYHDVLEEHAADLARALKPGAWFVASGCSLSHRATVSAAFASAGLAVDTAAVRGRWATFAGRRGPAVEYGP